MLSLALPPKFVTLGHIDRVLFVLFLQSKSAARVPYWRRSGGAAALCTVFEGFFCAFRATTFAVLHTAELMRAQIRDLIHAVQLKKSS